MLEVVVLPYLVSSSSRKDRSRDVRTGQQEMPLRGKGLEARASANHYPHARNPGLCWGIPESCINCDNCNPSRLTCMGVDQAIWIAAEGGKKISIQIARKISHFLHTKKNKGILWI